MILIIIGVVACKKYCVHFDKNPKIGTHNILHVNCYQINIFGMEILIHVLIVTIETEFNNLW